MRPLIAVLLLAAATPAFSAPLAVRNGHAVRVRVAGRHERGVGLKPDARRSWKLQLAPSSAPASAEVFDVTEGVVPTKWVVSVENGAIAFDPSRFVAGHAYRVELKRSGSVIVYLYPPVRSARAERVTFDAADDAAESDGIAITPKSAL